MVTKKSSKKAPGKFCIIANKSYGLYAGVVKSFDPVSGVAEVEGCRHVARWYGKTGGITSLAAYGLCGPQAMESRIGAPVSATLSGVVNVFECSPGARASIESAVQK